MQILQINQLRPQELKEVVNIHLQELTESTLNKFGSKFLQVVYKSAVKNNNNILLVLKEDNKIIGFTLATKSSSNFYHQIITENFFTLTWEVIKSSLSHPKLILETALWFLLPQNTNQKTAELQFIAIDKSYQGKGWGKKLIQKLTQKFSLFHIHKLQAGTWASNDRSNNFYKRLNFDFIAQKEILGAKLNYYLLSYGPKK